eukprot:TRINITY_DN31123_c0_g1_i1.p1 TRINITY_DN31123_c0_g1~~TRINITY_DN31123_c0_g1_i1.p1  ORF type:complete len:266 (+),score=48.91 TRINITY_DN31123_c0_g1_i1:81-878(+)
MLGRRPEADQAPPPGAMRFGTGNDLQRSQDEIRIIKEMLTEEVDQFIITNRIDGAAARHLKNEPCAVQFAVLDRGPLLHCTNPSGALVGRIRDSRKGLLNGTNPSQPPSQNVPSGGGGAAAQQPVYLGGNPELERFIIEQRLDIGAATTLRSEPREIQDQVLALGAVINASNPSAALIGRLKNIKAGKAAGTPNSSGYMPPSQQGGFPGSSLPALSSAPAAAAGLGGGSPPSQAGGSPTDSALNEAAMRAIQFLSSKLGNNESMV